MLLKRIISVLMLLALFAADEINAEDIHSRGETLYVPAYSHVYSGPKKNPIQLAIMLSIRNVDPDGSFTVSRVDYYDNDGRLVRRFLASPVTVTPLATKHYYIEEKDTIGGFGANFIVRWESVKPINKPIVESVMIGASGGRGISFVSPAKEIK